jgi:hydroxymethylpyrimidine pyrophosphatase-like HAD family hydrolase
MVKDGRGFILGLDLHGTLLEPGEIIRREMISPVCKALEKIKDRVACTICTGNDLEFVKRKVPQQLIEIMEGCVLETGCSASMDWETEEVLTSSDEQENISSLKAFLKEINFPEINYFAHRLTTISMFCGNPLEFHKKIVNTVTGTKWEKLTHITYSSVAVDILPAGYNKAKGLYKIADGKKTIGVADSMNDKALLAEADYSFAPLNMAPELVPILNQEGRQIIKLESLTKMKENIVTVANKNETEGVIKILEFIDQEIPH